MTIGLNRQGLDQGQVALVGTLPYPRHQLYGVCGGKRPLHFAKLDDALRNRRPNALKVPSQLASVGLIDVHHRSLSSKNTQG